MRALRPGIKADPPHPTLRGGGVAADSPVALRFAWPGRHEITAPRF